MLQIKFKVIYLLYECSVRKKGTYLYLFLLRILEKILPYKKTSTFLCIVFILVLSLIMLFCVLLCDLCEMLSCLLL